MEPHQGGLYAVTNRSIPAERETMSIGLSVSYRQTPGAGMGCAVWLIGGEHESGPLLFAQKTKGCHCMPPALHLFKNYLEYGLKDVVYSPPGGQNHHKHHEPSVQSLLKSNCRGTVGRPRR
jgi:hypothetical protein